MKYYSYSQSLAQTHRKPPRPKPAAVPPEPIPKTIDQLDVLLTLWIAEAILEHDSLVSKRAKRAQRRRSPAPR